MELTLMLVLKINKKDSDFISKSTFLAINISLVSRIFIAQ